MTKTNFCLIRELDEKFHPQNRRTVSPQEVSLIKETLELENATELELRNMRDFVVAYLGYESEEAGAPSGYETWVKMHIIIHVIDTVLFDKSHAV